MYTKKVMDIFQNPTHAGELKSPSAVGRVGNAACGDIMEMYLKIDENEVITNASFKTFGCTAAIVSTEVACQMIIGKTLDEASKITNKQVLEEIGTLPPAKIHCSILAEESIAEAIKNYRKKHQK